MGIKNKNVVVTGGKGFLGSYVCENIKNVGCKNITTFGSRTCDLTYEGEFANFLNVLSKQLRVHCVDTVIHLAANVGGIGYNQENPATLFFNNLLMGTNTLHEAWIMGVKKFVGIGTICSYPKFTEAPFKEEDIWNGYPEETNAPYGLAKKMLLVQSQAYRNQYGFNAIYLLPVNLYGPKDNFNPDSSHVIPALIKKCLDAIEKDAKEIVVWGTGSATREFLYVEDAAEAIVLASEHYNKPEPVNIGSGCEISIKDLVNIIVNITKFKGKVVWDESKPDGQPRRVLDTAKAYNEFGFKAKTSLEEGLVKTIDWYVKSRINA